MRRLLLAPWLLLWTLLLAIPALAHQPTFSRVELRLGPEGTAVEARLPILALLHEAAGPGGSPLPRGTTEADLHASPLAPAVSEALAGLLTDRLRLSSGGEALPLTVEAVEAAGDDVAIRAAAPPVAGALGVEADLFPEDALHKVFVNVHRGDALAGQWALDAQGPSFVLDAPARPLAEVVATFVREGVRHIFIGPDPILFALALILLGGSLPAQVKIITAFTVAHSVTLTLATLGLVTLPSRLVESAIALSVVVVELHDPSRLRRAEPTTAARDPRPLFAFAFGLVHGFGFAIVLGELDLPREALAWSLAAFNVGVEMGQVAIVMLAAPVVVLLRRHAPPAVARGVLAAAAGAVVLTGGLWFWERALGA